MITYYDDRGVRVTSASIEVAGRRYRLSELSGVWQRRGGRSWRALAGRGALVAALCAPIAAAGLGIALAVRSDVSTRTAVTLVAVCLLVGFALGPLADLLLDRMDRSYDRGTRDLQLWAEVQGRPVLLLHTRDALRFGQIRRAVQRALEARPPARR